MFPCRMSLVAPLVVFLRPVLCFRGARRSSMMFPCVFATSRKVCAFVSSVGSLLGASRSFFSTFCFVLGQFVGLREACCARFLHRGSARARICASWRRQTTNSEANGVTKSIFVLPQGSIFGPRFVIFFVFFGILRFFGN